MRVLALNGSPRKKGNTDFLLTALIKEFSKRGAITQKLDLDRMNIIPCKEYTTCEKKGVCPIHDDVETIIYPAIRNADIVILGSPVFFYNITAQAKAVVDRTQLFWARIYRLRLTDPKKHFRRGLGVSVGATKGKQLFLGLDLTVKYFNDAIGAIHEDGMYYRGIEHRGDMSEHPELESDIISTVNRLAGPLASRPGVLFLDQDNSGASQIAAGLMEHSDGERLEVISAGMEPADAINPMVEEVMAEQGIDMAFRMTRSFEDALTEFRPSVAVCMGDTSPPPELKTARIIRWNDLPSVSDSSDSWKALRDELNRRVTDLTPRLEIPSGI